MRIHLQREIENLKKDILTLGAMAEYSVREATLAIERRDEVLAQSVIEKDLTIDQMEVEVEESCLKILVDFVGMARKTQEMLKQSLDALVNINPDVAREVCACDDEIDALNRQMFILVQDAIHTNPEDTETLIHLLSASRHLERIADHTTNIAEDVIYMIEGQIVRHKAEEYKSQTYHQQTS
jgi:phosphate transport system protein